jgi:hypothetical protein
MPWMPTATRPRRIPVAAHALRNRLRVRISNRILRPRMKKDIGAAADP